MTEYIVSIDDDLKDYEEMFVGNVRDGDVLTRCKDCACWQPIMPDSKYGMCTNDIAVLTSKRDDYCSHAERKE